MLLRFMRQHSLTDSWHPSQHFHLLVFLISISYSSLGVTRSVFLMIALRPPIYYWINSLQYLIVSTFPTLTLYLNPSSISHMIRMATHIPLNCFGGSNEDQVCMLCQLTVVSKHYLLKRLFVFIISSWTLNIMSVRELFVEHEINMFQSTSNTSW